MNKKGISPLIATVLIIGFTIALALVIFTWGKNFVVDVTEQTGEKAKTQLSCINDVEFKFRKGCYGAGFVEFTLENKKDQDVKEFLIRIHGAEEDKIDTVQINESLSAFDIQKYNIPFNIENVGSVVTKLELIRPVIRKGSEDVICSDVSREFDVTETCQTT
ncbi:MAG: hypothetical protein HYS32_00455 [Candidatus Woesearchaeota archaeon]|nr:MAG: hypothetical protein HYS32_00455 [Candidatus Woesearchaeota archaeon]